MNCPSYVDAEMREILDALGMAIVPRKKRPARVRTNWHAPYYSRSRFRRV